MDGTEKPCRREARYVTAAAMEYLLLCLKFKYWCFNI